MAEEGKKVDPIAVTMAAKAAVLTLTDGGMSARARPAPSSEEELIGEQFAHFRLDRRLGKGGMGEVYLATDLALERPVALKVLAREIATDPDSRTRFISEARAQARLHHPNICHIYFIGEQNGRLFFAMEYVEGENLQERLEREGKLPLDEAVELCRMTAAGLADAYQHGFTHRDVKPSNLLIDKHGVVKVADFGLVKDARRAVEEAAVVGTPLYMSPEQARGEDVDFRADVYALGVTLHQLVSGAPPFTGTTPMDLVSKHLFEPRPRLEAASGRAALVDALVERMMAKKPEDRPGGYDEVMNALEDLSTRVTRPAGFWVRSVALGLDFLLAAAAGGVVAGVTRSSGNVAIAVALAALLIIGNARWGSTPGKSALEIETTVLERLGTRARRGIGWRRSLLRFLAQLGLPYLALSVSGIHDLYGHFVTGPWDTIISVVTGALMFVPPLLFGVFSTRSAGKRAFWDKVAGTRVVYRRHRAG